jgi:alpha-galactosidase
MTVSTTRRTFLGEAALSVVGLALAEPAATRLIRRRRLAPSGFADLRREPDAVVAQLATGEVRLARGTDNLWTDQGMSVATRPGTDHLQLELRSPDRAVRRLHFRWRSDLSSMRLTVGDAWERAYGDLEWRGWVPDRVMPWYFASTDGPVTHAYGVRTGAKAFCYWQVDPAGISLLVDVRSGAQPIELGSRTLIIGQVICREGREGESAFAAIHDFCRSMCANPRLPAAPVYGSNDWYWAYGKNSAGTVMSDVGHIVELSPTGSNRPFAVIDDGWQPGRGADKIGAGTWDHGNEKFGDMAALASRMKSAGSRPGIWVRPLQAPADAPAAWRSARDRSLLDPTVPEVRQKITDDLARIRGWGFEMIKHDYTTYDIFGRWGYQMGSSLTRDGWTFASGSNRTTAEVIDDLYTTIRAAAGDALIIGCNTVSHLSAGHFEICRVGDDTSGTEWARTRKMGVNTLAFRGAQHGAFYVSDPDCVGVTNAVPWSLNRQWLDLLARSGTMLFVSLAPDALGAEQRRDLENALTLAAQPHPLGEPLDWQGNVYPSRWRLMGSERRYDWVGPDGAGG